jgi:hypothetical protein
MSDPKPSDDASTSTGGSGPTAERPDFGEGYTSTDAAPFDPPPWSAVQTKLAASRNYWVTTTRADGSPHAAPVWGVWVGRGLAFATSTKSVKGANLLRDRRVVVHLESGDDVVIVTGSVSLMRPEDASEPTLLDAYEAKYAFRPEPGASQDDAWFLLLPSTVVCWNETDFVNSQVRYRFG